MREALSWAGTPFVDCADVKGPAGGVDCAQLATGAAKPRASRPGISSGTKAITAKKLRNGMRERMRHSPLMQETSFTLELEQLYRKAWRRHCTGQF